MKAKNQDQMKTSRERKQTDLAAAASRLSLPQVLPVRGLGQLRLRPILPADELRMVEFHRALSEETIYSRYFAHLSLESRVKHDRLVRICRNEPDSIALVAASGTSKRPAAILAVGRLSRTDDPEAAEFALLVNDRAQGHGLGTALMKALMKLARACGMTKLVGEVLVANHEMLYVCRQFGFALHTVTEDGLVQVSLDL